jgi:proteasome lid subunit RPN8/RPN11
MSDERQSEAMGLHLQRVLPLAQSVLWHPTSPGAGPRRPPSGPYPTFFDQKAIAAINAHYETAGRQGMMGFLVGDLFECPTSRVRYVVIDSTIRLNQAVYGDKTLVIVSRLWDRIQEELRKTDGHLIGWYHSHPPLNVELAPGDVETHLQYFKRPWHLALVLGSEHEGPVAGLFRPRPGETASTSSMPFYELIESDEGFAGGKKHSVLPWINLLTDDAAVIYHEAAVAHPPPAPQATGRATVEVVRAQAPASRAATPPAPPAPPLSGTQARPGLGAPKPAAAAASAPPAASEPPTPPAPPPAAPGTVARPALGDALAAGGRTPGRRDTQMKPPANALSNLPLVAAGGYDVGEVESREADPMVMTPRHTEVPRLPPSAPLRKPVSGPTGRPTLTPKPFAPALAPRRVDGHPGVVAAVLLLALAGGAGAGWYFFLRPRSPATPPPAPTTPATMPAPADTTWLAFDRIGDTVSVAVRGYDEQAQTAGTSPPACTGLSEALIRVEDAWTGYNINKKRAPPLDTPHATRDAGLYAAVDSVERHFDRSGCQRP